MHTISLVPESHLVYKPAPGTVSPRQFVSDFWFDLTRPGTTGAIPYEVNFAHCAPKAAQLAPLRGVWCEIDWLLILDNAGRKWEIRPSRGGRVRGLAWYRRTELG